MKNLTFIIVFLSLSFASHAANNPKIEYIFSAGKTMNQEKKGKLYSMETLRRTNGYLIAGKASHLKMNNESINLVETGVVLQPRFLQNEVLMFNLFGGGYYLKHDGFDKEYNAYFGGGFIASIMRDRIRLNGQYKKYSGSGFKRSFQDSKQGLIRMDLNLNNSFSLNTFASFLGENKIYGIGLNLKY